ncbi:condensation domain-containing protein [Plantactinospora sp. KBS50]|uniref:condensation domain-containing protein n=1 Tax=Plantactinospora sp. KBS50 TaxID=2024580 RepID=UPI001E427D5C|nr:condensation domain-containing protein [Plantactinospora sp. KBS50]
MRDGRPVRLPARTTSFRRWSQALRRHALSRPVCDQLPYWQAVPNGDATAVPGRSGGANLVAQRATVTAVLDAADTARLTYDVPRAAGVSVHQLLLTALLVAWHGEFGCTALQVDVEGHGREPIDAGPDVSRTVGWFTSVYPVTFDIVAGGDPLAVLAVVRSRLDAVPDRGLGYGLLRYCADPEIGERLSALPQSQLSFNYLGRFEGPSDEGAVFGVPLEIPTVLQRPEAPRRYQLEVAATVAAGQLTLEWVYGTESLDQATVRSVLDRQVAAVRTLAERLLADPRAAGRSGTPFPLASLSHDQLAAISRRTVGR